MPTENRNTKITRRWVELTCGHVPAEREFSQTVDLAFVRLPGGEIHGEVIAWHDNGHYFIAIHPKNDHAEVWKQELSRDAFDVLWQASEGSRLRKDCSFREHAGYKMRVSTYDLSLPGFQPRIVECDFETIGQAAGFILPESMWRAVDVSDDPNFDERNLATNPEAARATL